jgi:hypothetical protein
MASSCLSPRIDPGEGKGKETAGTAGTAKRQARQALHLKGRCQSPVLDSVPLGRGGNDPFGSRPEPGARLISPILLLPHGEAPEGRAKFTKSIPVHARERRL